MPQHEPTSDLTPRPEHSEQGAAASSTRLPVSETDVPHATTEEAGSTNGTETSPGMVMPTVSREQLLSEASTATPAPDCTLYPHTENPASPPRPPHPKKPGFWKGVRDFGYELVKIAVIVLLLRAYVIQASSVDGHSMEATLHNGDLLLVERLSMSLDNGPDWLRSVIPDVIFPELKRGEIVVLTSPEDAQNELVKRVIAIEDDFLFFYEGQVFVNGEAQAESYLDPEILRRLGTINGLPRHYHESDMHNLSSEYRPTEMEFLNAMRAGTLATLGVRIPKHNVFVMGDNREPNKSNDSRAWAGIMIRESRGRTGTHGHMWVAKRAIHGKVFARLRLPWEYDSQHPVFPR